MGTPVKCLVWDLDDTLWRGVVLEGDRAEPVPEAVRTLRELDERGILHATASRGDHATAVAHLERLGLKDLFTVVEVGWGAKSGAVRRVAELLNLGLDSFAFIDNDPVERAEVVAALPQVRAYAAEDAGKLPGLTEFQPVTRTAESAQRRRLYQVEAGRRAAEEAHDGTAPEFLASLGLTMTIRRATAGDLARAHELTVRTHQLNTTGLTFDERELGRLAESPDHEVLVAELTDRFGPYGVIGLALTESDPANTTIKLLLTSCRVASRGAGAALIEQVVRRSLAAGRRPRAEFVPTEVNRIMLVTLRFSGFEVEHDAGDRLLLAHRGEPVSRSGHIRVLAETH
ncbi:HAD family hydrolase [Amycolatopsis sp. 195334CR]|uniref:HAD-IIIC family phosphatase n=1 Tax=Amycolatopsis sp. 195334CR TaxID=2814588 RepID=UPI001A8F0CA9|nr:HAD-IIIC family phosphatase [Amycolatopsis sp. 195334CR]MBN6039788.1 HAD-IIIC family phosphatase [Amycolatopsis sp. 195334CR]